MSDNVESGTNLAKQAGRWDNYRRNEITLDYFRHLEPLNLHGQVAYAMDYLEDAITKAISPNDVTCYDDKTFSEKANVARIQGILTEQQWQECKSLESVRTIFHDRPDVTFESRMIAGLCSRLEMFDPYCADNIDYRLKFVTSAHKIANETFYRWVI